MNILSEECTVSPGRSLEVIFIPQGPIHRPALWLQALEGCDALMLTSLTVGHEEQLAVGEAPAAILEPYESIGFIVLPSVDPGSRVTIGFANRGEATARFKLLFGPPTDVKLAALRAKGAT